RRLTFGMEAHVKTRFGVPRSLSTAALIAIASGARAQGTSCTPPCHPPMTGAAGGPAGPGTQNGNQAIYFEFQVERPAAILPYSVALQYPDSLKAAGIEGEVVATFIVDTLGMSDRQSLKILKSTHRLFSDAVRQALPQVRFSPAEI